MARFMLPLLGAIVLLSAAAPQSTASAQTINVPPGTRIELVVTRPVWAKSAKAGDMLYAQTIFPVSLANEIAIPAGTYVESKIVQLILPTRKSTHAEFQILSSKLIFANGYTVLLAATDARVATPAATITSVTAQVSRANDLLLDNGAQFEITLASPLLLNAEQVASATPVSRAPVPGQLKSAALCRPTAGFPGTSGSPDTVIPGSPGTPSTTIPGMNGAPDTVIPGTPATPATVIPGTPGTPGSPGSVCPGPPLVLSSVPVPATP